MTTHHGTNSFKLQAISNEALKPEPLAQKQAASRPGLVPQYLALAGIKHPTETEYNTATRVVTDLICYVAVRTEGEAGIGEIERLLERAIHLGWRHPHCLVRQRFFLNASAVYH